MNRLKMNCENISPIAIKMMLYGTMLALGVLILGVFVCKYNELFIGGYTNHKIGIAVVQAGVSLFIQFIIGGIIFDCVSHGKNEKRR